MSSDSNDLLEFYMEKSFHHFCLWHLGDHLMHLNFLRRVAKVYPDCNFYYYAPLNYISQLAELAFDVRNLSIGPMTLAPLGALNVWRGVDGILDTHPDKYNFADFHLFWFDLIAKKMGLVSPVRDKRDLLFDYPAIKNNNIQCDNFQILLINSEPLSRQADAYDEKYFDDLARKFRDSGISFWTTKKTSYGPCTQDYGLTVTGIGTLSLKAETVCGVSTGPSWPTFNVWNESSLKKRLFLLSSGEQLDFVSNIVTVESLSMFDRELRDIGYIF